MAGNDYTCAENGAGIVAHKQCSVAGCDGEHKSKGLCIKHYMQIKRKGLDHYTRRIKCSHCGNEFDPTRADSMYCSKRCKQAAWKVLRPDANAIHRELALCVRRKKKEAEPKYTLITFNICVICSKPFVSKRKAKYCCKECSPSSVKAAKMANQLASRACVTCGKLCGYTFGRGKIYCSKSCARQSESYKESKRASKAKRRAIERGATVETVKPFTVFDRDKWRCQLCGVKTPKALRNTIKDNAPELDHIIPLSKGGEHSYRNTQCACRRCNGLKSDRPMGQMLLIG